MRPAVEVVGRAVREGASVAAVQATPRRKARAQPTTLQMGASSLSSPGILLVRARIFVLY